MIRFILMGFLFLFMMTGFVSGKKKVQKVQYKDVLSIKFNQSKKNHQYTLREGSSKYLLVFTDEKRKTKRRFISQGQAEWIKREGGQILWKNKYKSKPIKNCTHYVTLKLHEERTSVCAQNTKLVGPSYGFLNALRNLF